MKYRSPATRHCSSQCRLSRRPQPEAIGPFVVMDCNPFATQVQTTGHHSGVLDGTTVLRIACSGPLNGTQQHQTSPRLSDYGSEGWGLSQAKGSSLSGCAAVYSPGVSPSHDPLRRSDIGVVRRWLRIVASAHDVDRNRAFFRTIRGTPELLAVFAATSDCLSLSRAGCPPRP